MILPDMLKTLTDNARQFQERLTEWQAAMAKGQEEAMEQARRNMVKVSLKHGTIHHNVRGEHGAAKVLMAPAKPGDGIIAGLQVLAALQRSGQSLADWIADLQLYPQKMVNVPLKPGSDWSEHTGLQQAREKAEYMLGERGRVLIRASGTEPKLRLMVEADDEALAEACIEILAAVDLTT